jgi:hypothetical protein
MQPKKGNALLHVAALELGPTKFERAKARVIKYLQKFGSSPEAPIRHHYGNTPDVSKALRALLKLGMVTREGKGGRNSTYMYHLHICNNPE